MDINRQIKRYRTKMKLSQDELAEKVYVTRQTVSNWENGHSYPDIRSLLLLSGVFGISLDILIKGDLEEMKEQIKDEDIQKLKKDSRILSVLLLAMLLLPVPLGRFLGWIGVGVYILLSAAGICVALKIEKQKKAYDIQTYREIVAFAEGKRLDELEKQREIGKRPYQKFLLAVASGTIALAAAFLIHWLLNLL